MSKYLKYYICFLLFISTINLRAGVTKNWEFWMRSASDYYEKSNYSEAVKFLDSAAKASDAPNDSTSMNLAAYYALYGHNLLAMKKYQGALQSFQKTLAIVEKTDYKDVDLSDVYEGIGLAYAGLNLPIDAEVYFIKNYDYAKTKFKDNSPEMSNAALNLGFNYYKAKNYEKAILRLNECIQIREAIFGNNDKALLEPVGALIEIYDSLAKYEDFEKFLLKALQIKVKTYGKVAPELVPELNRLSEFYKKNDRFLDLEKIYLSLVKVYEQLDEKDATFTAEIYVKLAELCKTQKIDNRAQIYYDKAVEKIRYYTCETKKAASVFASAAMFYATNKNYDKAVYYFNESIDLLEKKKLQTSDEYFTILNNVAALCVSIDDFDKAFIYFAKAESVLDSNPNKKARYAKNLYLNIAYSYKKIGNAEKYEEYVKKSE